MPHWAPGLRGPQGDAEGIVLLSFNFELYNSTNRPSLSLQALDNMRQADKPKEVKEPEKAQMGAC